MDYEKKYKEALEQAKKELATCGSMDCDAARLILRLFPQLRESEDERILRVISEAVITFFSDYANDFEDEDRDAALAWLEKQKEQNWNKKPCLTCQEYEKGHKQGYTEGCTAGYNKAMKEVEQKEQKPAEYLSKEKVYVIMKKLTSLSFGVPLGSDEEKQIDEITRDVRDLLDCPIEQKPEWSEEDEKMLWNIISIVGQSKSIKADEMLDWLKSLRPSWKPSENELAKKYLEGYTKGRNDALRKMSDFVESHFNIQSGTSIKSGGNE